MDKYGAIVGYLLLGGGFLFFTGMNYGILIMRWKKAERIPSPAPLLGGFLGAVLVICIVGFRYPLLILLPFVIDPGSIPLLIELIIWFIKGTRKDKQSPKTKE